MMKRIFSLVFLGVVLLSVALPLVSCSGSIDYEAAAIGAQGDKTITYGGDEKNSDLITIQLNYNGGVSTSSSVTIAKYGETIGSLPSDLKKDGYQFIGWYLQNELVADAEGKILNQAALKNEMEAVMNGEKNHITLSAGWEIGMHSVTLILNGKRYTVKVKDGDYLSEIALDKEKTATAFSVNQNGYPLFNEPVKKDISLHVVGWHTSVKPYSTVSCKVDNGYNPAVSGSEGEVYLTKNWHLGEVKVNTDRNSSFDCKYTVSFELTRNTHYLPLGEAQGLNLKDQWLSNDGYSGNIKGTSINGRIGYGAYYVKVLYKNGSKEEFDATNFLADMGAHDTKELCTVSASASNPIKSIYVTVVAETAYNNNISYWLGCKWFTNVRYEYRIDI